MFELQKVKSSVIHSAGTDEEGRLAVCFTSNPEAVYVYGNTDRQTLRDMLSATSPGEWFIRNIRCHPELYPHHVIDFERGIS